MQTTLSAAGLGRRWRQTDATMDVELLGAVSIPSSVERQTMREQLDTVRQTLNSLSTQAQPNASGINALPAGLENVLAEIFAKLTNIEGLYANLTNKLEKVDLRVEDSERHIRELQHFSASAIHETARLVDYVGGRGTPNVHISSHAGAGPPGVGVSARPRNLAASGVLNTPPQQPDMLSPRSAAGFSDFMPLHLTSTIQQHTTQIHKVIAGLDFLEAHIIRQDQILESLQKQMLSVARDVASTSAHLDGRSSPSELSLRVHDMSEMINKLRAHMYKVEKKTSNNDQALALLIERVHAVELSAASGGRQQQREARESSGGQSAAAAAPSALELLAAQEELRAMMQDVSRDVLELRDQLRAQQQTQASQSWVSVTQATKGMFSEESAEISRQLSYLMSQVPDLLAANKELKDFSTRASKQIDNLYSELEQQKRCQREQQQQQLRQSESTGRTEANEAAVAELKATVADLQRHMSSLENRQQTAAARADVERLLSSALQAVESKMASVDAVANMGTTLTSIKADVTGLQGRIAAFQDGLGEQSKEAAVSRLEIAELSAAVQALAAEQSRAAGQLLSSAAEDVATKLQSITEYSPEAALLASQVSASAKADLEEQFGQLRQRVETAAAAADVAEAAAQSSAESAAAALEAVDAAGKASKAASASLQDTVQAMVTGLEQEHSTLKQQLAQLAAQVSEEQAAISSSLLQVQEQVVAATSAATEAAICARDVQEQQAASGQRERESAEQLRAMQVELRQQVASVMERLKERVEQGVQQMDAQLSTVSDRLAAAVTAQQLEQLRTAAAELSERYDLTAASVEELRGELTLFIAQQDVLQSRLQGMESVLGIDPRSNRMDRCSTSSILPSKLTEDPERQDDGEDQGPRPVQVMDPRVETTEGCGLPGVPGADVAVTPTGDSHGRRGLLDVVTELQLRVGGLERSQEASTINLDELRVLMQSNVHMAQDTIQQATAQLMSNVQDLSAAVDQRVASTAADLLAMEIAFAALQEKVAGNEGLTNELAARIEGLQLRLENEVVARIQETSNTVSSLLDRIANDYVSREQLGAIFKARDNMKRAVDELASVFSTGCLTRTVSADEDDFNAADPAEAGGIQRGSSGTLSPRLVLALEELAGKQVELEHQVQLALYRTESSVRQEQLASVQQAMLTLEMQFRRLGSSAQQAPSTAPAEAAKYLSDLRERVEALEVARGTASASPSAVAGVSSPSARMAITIANSATPRRAASTPGDTLRVSLTPKDPADGGSPIRLRVRLKSSDGAGTPRLSARSRGSTDPGSSINEECTETPLSPVLHVGRSERNEDSAWVRGSPKALSPAAAALDTQSELGDLRRVIQDLSQQIELLRSEKEMEVAERQRMAEALAELQERLDLQVNTSASTAAVVATMATLQMQEPVRLQVPVGASEAEADLAALASTVSTLLARVAATEDALASAFVVRTPRHSARAVSAGAADAAPAKEEEDRLAEAGPSGSGSKDIERAANEEASSEAGLQPALGMMVPVLPHEVEHQLAELQAALIRIGARVDGLEAVDALEEVRAAASEAVLDAIPGMVSQQVAVVREEISALLDRQENKLLEFARQAARDAVETTLAVREAVVQATAEGGAEVRATSEGSAKLVSSSGELADDEKPAVAIHGVSKAVAREVALGMCLGIARETVEETACEATVKEIRDIRGAVESLTERMNDVDTLRDQLEALAAQVRESVTVCTTATAEAIAQGPPATPTAAAVASIFTPATKALVIAPACTPRGASPSTGGSRQTVQAATGSQQAAFLARLVEVVKRQSSCLHAQYCDAEETGVALAQVAHTLEEAEARLADVFDANSPAFAKTLVTVLEQVAALRYIGSQTHPAIQQMVLEHENRLDKITEDLKSLSGGSPSRTNVRAAAAPSDPVIVEELVTVSRQVARIEAEVARVASQHTTLDRAVKEMLVAVGSIRLTSVSPSAPGSLATLEDAPAPDSRRVSTRKSEVLDEALVIAADGGKPALEGGMDRFPLEFAGLAAYVRLLEGTLDAQLSGLRHELMAEIRTRAGTGGGSTTLAAATTAPELGELERTVTKLHSAVTAIRNRLLAMQEYIDSTQGMVKDMHVALGGLVRRVDGLEAASTPSNRSTRISNCGSVSGGGSADSSSIREFQSDLNRFERRLLTVESSTLDAAHVLAGLKGLVPRVTEVESRLLDTSSKLAMALGGSASSTTPIIPTVAPGTSLPAVMGTVHALERRLGSRVEAACGALDTLASALSAAGRIQVESTNNPFKAISAAVNNPVIVAMEKKLETVRVELVAAATSLSEDMRRDQQQQLLESRLASADPRVSGGGTFRL